MSTERLNIENRRSAIASSLEPYISSVALEEALSLWEQRYSNQPVYALNHFLNDVCETDDLKHCRRHIMRQMLRALTSLEQRDW